MADHILLLAGTFEARKLASQLADIFPETRLTVSFAGAVKELPSMDVPVRTGGFGGAEGLACFLQGQKVSLVIDATHPFAAQMSSNAATACTLRQIPLLRLERPAWEQMPGDAWHFAATMEEAVSALPAQSRAFLAVGRKEIQFFYQRLDCYALARMIEPPAAALPAHWDLILARPPQSVEDEAALLRSHDITHVVSKNSGGHRSYAKIAAARQLGLPVFMIARPVLPAAQTANDMETVLEHIRQVVESRPVHPKK